MNWLQPAPDAMVTPDSADPSAIVTAREGLRLALIASLQFLPPRQRAILVLRDVLAFPATEVAVMLGTTTVSVKSGAAVAPPLTHSHWSVCLNVSMNPNRSTNV